MDLDRLLLRLRLYKLETYVVESTVLFHEILPGSELKSGYVMVNDRDCCWHTWVEKDGQVYDLGLEIAKKNDPEFGLSTIKYLENKPEGVEAHEDKELIDRFNGHIADFWKTAPKNFREFRTKFKKTLNK
tara:strand:+ start:1566 stop:1955 length:390 start_codon:yes stop_codon:yes gene_type:complete